MRNLHQLRNADELAGRLDRQYVAERTFVDRVGRYIADLQRVAVGRRLRGGFERDVAGSTGAIVDDEGLPERFLQLGRDVARNDVGGTAGRVRYEQLDRPIRIRLGGLR